MRIQCSNCGKHVKFDVEYDAEKVIKAGWRSFGGAFYCPMCVEEWNSRNGEKRALNDDVETLMKIYRAAAIEGGRR